MFNDDDDSKKIILVVIIVLAILIPSLWKIIEWINEIGLIEFSIYFLISVSSIIIYKIFKFLNKK